MLYVLFVVLDAYIVWIYLPWLFGLLGLGFFVKYIPNSTFVVIPGILFISLGIQKIIFLENSLMPMEKLQELQLLVELLILLYQLLMLEVQEMLLWYLQLIK